MLAYLLHYLITFTYMGFSFGYIYWIFHTLLIWSWAFLSLCSSGVSKTNLRPRPLLCSKSFLYLTCRTRKPFCQGVGKVFWVILSTLLCNCKEVVDGWIYFLRPLTQTMSNSNGSILIGKVKCCVCKSTKYIFTACWPILQKNVFCHNARIRSGHSMFLAASFVLPGGEAEGIGQSTME